MGIHSKGMRVCLWASALVVSPYLVGQNSAVSFNSSQAAVTDPQGFTDSVGAVAGFFHQNRKLDFLYGGPEYSNLATNNGNGTFTAAPVSGCDQAPNFATDLDGDGIWDIWCSSSSAVDYGDGHGGFSGPFHYPAGTTDSVLDAVAADFNGDGRTDIAVITQAGTLEILLNEGSRVFTLVHTYPLPSFTGTMPPVKLLAEDLNGDHKYDLVVIVGGAKASLTPYFATSGGAFTQGPTSSIGATLSDFINAAGRDVNRDGYGDVAVTTSTGVKLMLGTASGSFVSGTTLSSPGAGCSERVPGPRRFQRRWKGGPCGSWKQSTLGAYHEREFLRAGLPGRWPRPLRGPYRIQHSNLSNGADCRRCKRHGSRRPRGSLCVAGRFHRTSQYRERGILLGPDYGSAQCPGHDLGRL